MRKSNNNNKGKQNEKTIYGRTYIHEQEENDIINRKIVHNKSTILNLDNNNNNNIEKTEIQTQQQKKKGKQHDQSFTYFNNNNHIEYSNS